MQGCAPDASLRQILDGNTLTVDESLAATRGFEEQGLRAVFGDRHGSHDIGEAEVTDAIGIVASERNRVAFKTQVGHHTINRVSGDGDSLETHLSEGPLVGAGTHVESDMLTVFGDLDN